mmetsp:Transcript_7111/g.11714  ORF Transcript_7111/g.11714 Transcript_7111/m.11714 type:complete len:488 (+) Transcript_7111:139-1602(+)
MSRGSSVDETLFASKHNSRRTSRKGYTVISKSKLKNLLGQGDAVVLKSSELSAIKAMAPRTVTNAKTRSKEKYNKTLTIRSQQRKDRMMKKGKMGTVSIVEADKEVVVNKKEDANDLQKRRDEDHDDVKHMNQILLYAQCASIRDKQLEEKKMIAQRRAEEEKEVFMKMEEERVRAIRMVEEREKVKIMKRKEDAVMLRKQIQFRERERLRKRERAEQEAELMLERIKENERRQEEEARRKIEHGRKLHAEVMAANDAAARAKLRRKQEENEENERIARYIKQKELKEAREEERLAAIKAAKEQEVARLRAQQEKANDRRSELDELRARRYQEASDRRWRLAEKEKAMKQREMMRDMDRVRNEQRLYKEKAINEQRKQDQELHLRTLKWQKEQEEREALEAERKRMVRMQIQDTVVQQISEHERSKKAEREQYLTEGNKIKAALAQEKARIEAVKANKLMQMKKMGIPSKYQAELAKKKVLQSKVTH